MQAPKRKTSKSRRNMRRAHDGLTASYTTECKNCGEPVSPHRVCTACGYYRDRQIIEVNAAK